MFCRNIIRVLRYNYKTANINTYIKVSDYKRCNSKNEEEKNLSACLFMRKLGLRTALQLLRRTLIGVTLMTVFNFFRLVLVGLQRWPWAPQKFAGKVV